MRKQARAHRLALALVLCCASRGALGQTADPTADAANNEYEAALSRALDAHARGDDDGARVFMERAYELQPSARTLRGLGTIALAQGRTVEGVRYLERALTSEVLPLTTELRASVEGLLAHAWSQVGRYDLRATPEDAAWFIDGVAADFYLPNKVVLAPGQHVLAVRAPGHVAQEFELDVKPGERQVLERVLSAEPVPEARDVARALPEAASTTPRRGAGTHTASRPGDSLYTPTLRWIGLGAGGALLLGGAAIWTVGYVKLQNIDDECRNRTPSGCPRAEARRLYDDRHISTYALSSAVLAAAGAAMLVTVGILELSGAGSQHAAELRASATGAEFRGRF